MAQARIDKSLKEVTLQLRESEVKQYKGISKALAFIIVITLLIPMVIFASMPEKIMDVLVYIILYIMASSIVLIVAFLYFQGLAKTRIRLDQMGLHVDSGLPAFVQNRFGTYGRMPLQSWSAAWSEISFLQIKVAPQARITPGARFVLLGIHRGLRYRELQPYQWVTPEYEAKYPADSAPNLETLIKYWKKVPSQEISSSILLSPMMKFIAQQGLKVNIDEKAFIDTGVVTRRSLWALFLLPLAFIPLTLSVLRVPDADTSVNSMPHESVEALRSYPDLPRKVAAALDVSYDNIIAASFSSDGNYLAAGGKQTVAFVWKMPETQLLHRLEGHSDKIQGLAFSPDNQILASGSEDNSVRLWNMQAGTLQQVLKAPSPPGTYQRIFSVAFSPDGQYLAAANWDSNIYIWQMPAGNLWRVLKGSSRPWWDVLKMTDTGDGHSDSINAVVFSPDGKWLASGAFDNAVKLWDVKTWTLHKTLHWHSDWVLDVDFSPDGRLLASSGKDKQVRLWDVSTGERLRSLHGHRQDVASVQFHPSGQVLVSGSNDRSIKYWEVETGALLHTLPQQIDYVNIAIFSPDGKQLVTGNGISPGAKKFAASNKETVKVWQ